jgi:hypothetical protein
MQQLQVFRCAYCYWLGAALGPGMGAAAGSTWRTSLRELDMSGNAVGNGSALLDLEGLGQLSLERLNVGVRHMLAAA